MIYNGMCNNTKIDKTGRKIGKKFKELYILNVNDILKDFLTFFLLLNILSIYFQILHYQYTRYWPGEVTIRKSITLESPKNVLKGYISIFSCTEAPKKFSSKLGHPWSKSVCPFLNTVRKSKCNIIYAYSTHIWRPYLFLAAFFLLQVLIWNEMFQ